MRASSSARASSTARTSSTASTAGPRTSPTCSRASSSSRRPSTPSKTSSPCPWPSAPTAGASSSAPCSAGCARSAAPRAPPAADVPPAVVVSHLTWAYKAGGVPALPDLSFVIPRGCRCLLTGANGAGKTTLLRLIGGKHMVPDGQVSVLGRPVFRDLQLNTMVAMLSGDWTRSVACVGNGVPFQADFSVGEMTQRYRESLVADGMDEAVLLPRLARLQQLLDIDLKWRLNRVSDGQRRRCQLLLKLLRPSELLLMDE